MKSLEELEADNAVVAGGEPLAESDESGACAMSSMKSIGLRHALNYRERSVFKLVPAEIVTRDSSTWWRTVTINRGKEDGIEAICRS